ncbi:MAG TPA: FdtA/QdtA family cupin domain-containing protein [Chitinophagaceae bacterium]
MATLLTLKSVHDERGMLTVLDNIDESLPFPVKRIFYIQKATDSRGGHRHYHTQHAVICIVGSCKVTVNDGKSESTYQLNSPSQCLIMETSDWHTMHSFSKDAILLALASTVYDPTDYIYSPYEKKVTADDTV